HYYSYSTESNGNGFF
nr:immunoglobulin light chain junction region [Macaca mulatta]MOW00052.1 immunoglobulin light chain junction region [Macaca mulatta]MOW01066.1 immunoglobulin light chain junction region [Macaca mulatta]